jgi:hypothetical protein
MSVLAGESNRLPLFSVECMALSLPVAEVVIRIFPILLSSIPNPLQ